MNRPVGVTVIAVLDFVGAALCLSIGILSMVGAGAGIMGIMGGQSQGATALGSLVAVIAGALTVSCFLGAALAAVLGWGLWTLKNWARLISVVVAGIGALFQLLGLAGLMMHFNPLALVINLVFLAVNGLIAGYLLTKDVAAAFQGGQAQAASA